MEATLNEPLSALESAIAAEGRRQHSPEYSMISDVPPDQDLPWLDRQEVDEDRLTNPFYGQYFREWRDNGVVILRNLLPKKLREAYFAVREQLNLPGGWPDPCPYLYVPELRALSLQPDLLNLLDGLIGYPMGLHLNLTGWVSTERAWHQDDYLNPDFVNSHYAAVWIALRDIDPDCGPFEYVPGSHKWALTRREKVLANCPVQTSAADPAWPTKTQAWVSDIIQREIDNQGAPVHRFLAKEGDVLIWHGRLVHRGSLANKPGTPRHSCIAHYSAIEKRVDMQTWKERCFVPGDRAAEWKDPA